MDIARRHALGLAAGCALLGSTPPLIARPRVRVPATSFTFTTLHNFSALDGPRAPGQPEGVVLASDGLLYGLSASGGGAGGTAFRLATTGGEVKVVHRFGRTDAEGKTPEGQLLQGPDGHFYGVTSRHGALRAGTVFRMHPEGFVRTLHDFAGGPEDGEFALGPPTLADDGWLYGVTASGGKSQGHLGYGRGTIYRLKTTGEYELLHSFRGTRHGGDGSRPVAPLVQALDGLLYGVTVGGGAHENGSLYRINGATSYEVVYSFDVNEIGRSPEEGLTLASDGLLYGATSSSGGNGSGEIFRVRADGALEQVHAIRWKDEGGGISRLVEGSDGLLYFTLAAGDDPHRSGGVFRLDRGTGEVEPIHFFDKDTEGGEPNGTVALGPDGSVYGKLDLSPGGKARGAIYRLTPD